MDSTSPADTAAAVAAVIDSARPAVPPPSPSGRPPLPEEKLSMHPEAVRARNRRKNKPAAPVDTRPKFTAAMVKAEPPTPEPERTAAPTASTPTPEQITDAIKYISRAFKLAGTLAAKLLRDDAMNVTDDDANDVARQVIEGYPELAIIDADGKKFLAWFAVLSLLVAKWGTLQRNRAGGAPAASGRPPGEPVRVVPAPPSGGMMDPVTM